ncbi:MAG: tyrosine-protein phosphatase [Bacteroidota bacterium]
MFGLFKKKTTTDWRGALSMLQTDMHSHLLPGIDDGAPDVTTSVFLIKGLMELGYKKLITTSHIYTDLYPNTKQTILQAYDLLKAELIKEQIDIDLTPAAEYFIDEVFAAKLQKGEELLPIKDNKILVEISFVSPPRELNHVIFDMVTGGYVPIIAHPERYSYYHRDKDIYEQFKHQGCLIQVNMLSLIGYYGKPVQDIAIYLAKNGMIDLLGTDLHHGRHLAELQSAEMIDAVQELLKNCMLLNATL